MNDYRNKEPGDSCILYYNRSNEPDAGLIGIILGDLGPRSDEPGAFYWNVYWFHATPNKTPYGFGSIRKYEPYPASRNIDIIFFDDEEDSK